MMQEVERAELEAFCDRFGHFNDAVLRSIAIVFGNDGRKTAEICIAVRDENEIENGGWVALDISIGEVSEAAVVEFEGTTIQVLSHGIYITTFGDDIGVEFGGATDTPASLVELRQSQAYAVGRTVRFAVSPYE